MIFILLTHNVIMYLRNLIESLIFTEIISKSPSLITWDSDSTKNFLQSPGTGSKWQTLTCIYIPLYRNVSVLVHEIHFHFFFSLSISPFINTVLDSYVFMTLTCNLNRDSKDRWNCFSLFHPLFSSDKRYLLLVEKDRDQRSFISKPKK